MESLWPYEYMYNVLRCFNLMQSAIETLKIFYLILEMYFVMTWSEDT